MRSMWMIFRSTKSDCHTLLKCTAPSYQLYSVCTRLPFLQFHSVMGQASPVSTFITACVPLDNTNVKTVLRHFIATSSSSLFYWFAYFRFKNCKWWIKRDRVTNHNTCILIACKLSCLSGSVTCTIQNWQIIQATEWMFMFKRVI